jgi:beta-glucosidase-like glycosyl hydrolase
MTAMESYQEISGVPMVSSSEYLNGLLRHDIGYIYIDVYIKYID